MRNAPVRAILLSTATALTVSPAFSEGQIFDTESVRVEAEVLTDELENPWGLDFLPGGDVIVTERPGRIRLLSDGRLSEPLDGVPDVMARGQGGLLDIIAAPDFEQSGFVFFSFSEPGRGGAGTAIARAKLVRDGTPRLEDVEVIFSMAKKSRPSHHFGSRAGLRQGRHAFLHDRRSWPRRAGTGHEAITPAPSCASTPMGRSPPTTRRRTARNICRKSGRKVTATRKVWHSIRLSAAC